MKKIYSLSLFTFIGPFIATFFISLFVLLMQFLWKYIDELAGKGLDWEVITELLLYASAHLIPMAIPLAVLLSSIMTFGTLAENYELLAFKTTGVSLARIMRPLTVVVFFISIGAFFFANNGVPKANLKFKSLLYAIKKQKPAMDIPEGIFYTGIEGFSIRVNHKDVENDILYDVMIYDKSEGRGNVMVTRAEKGKMYITEDERFLVFNLENGKRYHEMEQPKGQKNKTYPHTLLSFEQYEIRFDLSSFKFHKGNEDVWKNSTQMLNIGQLDYYIDSTEQMVSKKLERLNNYSEPYFLFEYDSTFALNDSVLHATDTSTSYIGSFASITPGLIIQRAMSQARSFRGAIKSASNEMDYQYSRQRRAKIEWHRKFTMSLACFIMFFIGAPLGAIIRKGGLGLPVVYSTLIFVAFYIVMISGEKATKQGVISAFVGMWYPVAVIIPIAGLLTYKANRDSKVINISGNVAKLKALVKGLRLILGG